MSTIALSQHSAALSFLNALPSQPVDALYVHIPFCAHKCHYCDFYSITRQTTDRMDRFVDRLLAEAILWTDADIDLKPRTVFFGGGTPTALSPDQMHRLVAGLRNRVDLSNVDEWTIEANPATVDLAYCQMLRASGIDRLSFGAQSFDTAALALLERRHDPDDVARSIEAARSAGFDRLNIDLIFAIPGQTMSSWHRTLDQALSLRLDHLSCYALTYEPNTALTVRKRLNQIVAIAPESEIDQLHATRDRLAENDFTAYEISNFARRGQECRHNLHYWTGGNYAALGPSAASHVAGVRFKNRPHLGEWESAIDAGQLPATDIERLTAQQRAGEMIMLMLRLNSGVDFAAIERRIDLDVRYLIAENFLRYQSLELIKATAQGFCLTRSGIAVADAIAGEFLLD